MHQQRGEQDIRGFINSLCKREHILNVQEQMLNIDAKNDRQRNTKVPAGDWPTHWKDEKHEGDGGDGGAEILQNEIKTLDEWYGMPYATDDVTGAQLDAKMVKQARQVEMEYFRRMGVYKKIPRHAMLQRGGKTIQTRWIDVNKGDESSRTTAPAL